MKTIKLISATLGLALVAGIAHAQPGPSSDPGERLARVADETLARLDTSADGVVDIDEFVAARLDRAESRFQRADRDDDGLITGADFDPEAPPGDIDRAAVRGCVAERLGVDVPPPPEPGQRLAEADLDGDGAVDLGEALLAAEEAALQRFAMLDSNASGVLELAEIEAGLARAGVLRRAIRACREESDAVATILG